MRTHACCSAQLRSLEWCPALKLVLPQCEDVGCGRGTLVARWGHTPEHVITKLPEGEAALAQGRSAAQVCRVLGVTEQTLLVLA